MTRTKTIIAISLSLLLVLAIAAARAQAAPNLDANRNGVVTIDDYYYVQGCVSGWDRLSPEVFQACDLNGDGRLDPSDFMDYKQQYGLYDNPPLASNQQPKPGTYYPDWSWWLKIDFMGLV